MYSSDEAASTSNDQLEPCIGIMYYIRLSGSSSDEATSTSTTQLEPCIGIMYQIRLLGSSSDEATTTTITTSTTYVLGLGIRQTQ